MNIFEELWNGNICPSERRFSEDSAYCRALKKVEEERANLFAVLPQDQQIAVEKLMELQMDAAAAAELDAFVQGFRLAAQLLTEAIWKR